MGSAYENSIHVWSIADEQSMENLRNSGEANVNVEDSESESCEENEERNTELSNFMLETA